MNKAQIEQLKAAIEAEPKAYYIPENRDIIGGKVEATILLQQIITHYMKNKRRSFIMFVEPCKHPLYRSGLSWREELGLKRGAFESALRRIGTEIGGRVDDEEAKLKTDPTGCVVYWRNGREMWFKVNLKLVKTLGIKVKNTWTAK